MADYVESVFLKVDKRSEICNECGGAVRIGDWPICNGLRDAHVPARPSRHDFEAIVVFRDAHGNVRVPGKSSAKPPRGWRREEVTTRREAEAITRDMNAKDRRKWDSYREREAQFFDRNLARNRAEVQQLMQG